MNSIDKQDSMDQAFISLDNDQEDGRLHPLDLTDYHWNEESEEKAGKEDLEPDGVLDSSQLVVNLVAPSNIEAGHNVPVVYLDQDGRRTRGMAKVPEGGVQFGQGFQAEIVTSTPITGRWANSIFEIKPEVLFAFLSCWCTPVAWACLYESATNRPYGSWWITMLLLLVLFQIINFVRGISSEPSDTTYPYGSTRVYTTDDHNGDSFPTVYMIISIVFILTGWFARRAIRRKYQLPGDGVNDCVSVCLCGPCAAMQSYNQLASSQDQPPMYPRKEHPAILVVV